MDDSGAAARPELRASDADRERAVEVLREGFSQGRLTAEEFHERVDTAYAAKTVAQLADLTADLPPRPPGPAREADPGDPSYPGDSGGVVAGGGHWQPVGSPHRDVRRSDRSELQRIWGGWASMTIVLSTIWLLTGISGGFSDFWPIWPVGVFGAVCLARTVNRGSRRR